MKYKIFYKSLGGAGNLGNRIQFNNENLREAVQLWYDNEEQARVDYGDINEWDVSRVTNMRRLFKNKDNFNSNISNWNVSNVTNMSSMFMNASIFNQDISNWNTSNVTNMMFMFRGASVFNNGATNDEPYHPLLTNGNAWNTSRVTNMKGMFSEARLFDQDISNWNTSNVTSMSRMFNNARLFNQDISNWNTSNVTYMIMMFRGASVFNNGATNDDPDHPLLTNGDAWNTSSVTDMEGMFSEAILFNQDISNWNTSNVDDMEIMFSGAQSFNRLAIGEWIIRNDCVTDFMFLNSGITRETFIDENGTRIADFNRKIGVYFNFSNEEINYLRNIRIRTLTGDSIFINVNPYDQISYVKQIIRDHGNLNLNPNRDFRLITPTRPNQQMNVERSINSYNIVGQNGSRIIYLVMMLN